MINVDDEIKLFFIFFFTKRALVLCYSVLFFLFVLFSPFNELVCYRKKKEGCELDISYIKERFLKLLQDKGLAEKTLLFKFPFKSK